MSDFITSNLEIFCEEHSCHWIKDVCLSYTKHPKLFNEDFIVCTLKVKESKAVFIMDDGNENVLITQKIPFTDYEEDELKLYMCRNETGGFTLMRPEDY